jgi:hypothetical protein
MSDEYNTEIEAAVNKFVEENAEKLDMTKEQIFAKIGYYKEVKESSGTTSGDSKKETSYEPQYESFFEFVFKEKIQKPFNQLYPLPTK